MCNLSQERTTTLHNSPASVPQDVFNSGLRVTNDPSYGPTILSNSRGRGWAGTPLSQNWAKLDDAKSNGDHSDE